MSITSCEWVREHVALFVYGELAMEQEEQLQTHAAGCAACGELVASERRLHALLEESRFEIAEPLPAHLLVDSRRSLQASLARQAAEGESPWRRWAAFFHAEAFVWKPVAACALLLLGFSGAKWHSQYELNRELAAAPPVQLKVLKSAADGAVEIAYDVEQRRIVRGNVNDPAIRSLLVRAVSECNDSGERSRTVEALASAETDQVRDALLNVARKDPVAAVRAKAVHSLRPRMNERSTRQALVEVMLTDGDHEVRGQVADLFVLRPPDVYDAEVIGVMQEITRRETNGSVRAKVQRVLAGAGASPYIF